VDSALQEELRRRIEAFVSDLEGLIRQAALQAVAQALGAKTAGASAPKKRGPKPKKAAGKPSAKAGPKKRIRRSAADLDRVAASIFDYVTKNPGKRAEEIKSALQIPTASWGLPVKRLVDEGRIVARGAKRSTTYVAK
jgi:hypothetical protein